MGTRLVRMIWSGVTGPCCDSVPTSSRRAKASVSASAWVAMIMAAPAASDSLRRNCACFNMSIRAGATHARRDVPGALRFQVILGAATSAIMRS